MSTIVIKDKFKSELIVKRNVDVPRVGDNVYVGYNPPPEVSKVVWFPDIPHGECGCTVDALIILS